MAKKPNISNVASGYQSTTTINNNFENIRNAFDNILSRDGSTPNSMLADLDMNGRAILNVGVNSNNPNSILTVGTADARYVNTAGDTMTGNLTVPAVYATSFYLNGNPVLPTSLSYNGVVKETKIATAGQTVFNLSSISYTPGINNLAVYVDGVYQRPANYTENSATQVTFSVGLHVGAIVDFVVLTINSLGGTADAVNLTYTAPGIGANTRTVYSRLSDVVSVKDFGAVGDGIANDTTAIQEALTATTATGTLIIPSGTYLVSSDLVIPMQPFGAFNLIIEAGARINYTGNGYCFDANADSTPYANVNISGGGEIVGTSSGLAGIRYYCFNKGSIQNIRCRNFSNGDGILIEGANTIDIIDCEFVSNKNGLHLKSAIANSVSYNANAVRVLGGHFNANTQWGLYDDATGPAGACIGNYYAATFNPNGSNIAGTGNMFIQGSQNVVVASYFEYTPANYGPYQIVLGDGTYQPLACSIRGSSFLSTTGVTGTIYDNGTNTVIEANIEGGSITNFIVGGPNAIGRFIGKNFTYTTNVFTGTDNDVATISIGNAASSLLNTMNGSVTGMAFKSITGNGAPIKIRARASLDTWIAQFENYGGGAVARINTEGGIQPGSPSGTFTAANAIYQGSGVPSNANGNNGDFYFRTDTPGTSNQRLYVKASGSWSGIL